MPNTEHIADYYDLRKKLDELATGFKDVVTHLSYPFLRPRRPIKVKHQNLDFCWGAVITSPTMFHQRYRISINSQHIYFSDIRVAEANTRSRWTATGPIPCRCPAELCTWFQPLSSLKDATAAIPVGITPCPPNQQGCPDNRPRSIIDHWSHVQAVWMFYRRTWGYCQQERWHGGVFWSARNDFQKVFRYCIVYHIWASRMKSSKPSSRSVANDISIFECLKLILLYRNTHVRKAHVFKSSPQHIDTACVIRTILPEDYQALIRNLKNIQSTHDIL